MHRFFRIARNRAAAPAAQDGFSLIEIMVGLAIGMIGIIVMMQVFSFSEGNKRTTTGADDAQNNGIVALNGLLRETRHSGLGISDPSLLGCALQLGSGLVLPQ
ncbi:MAG: PilW family protein, partial [Janthinobacterium lividum]